MQTATPQLTRWQCAAANIEETRAAHRGSVESVGHNEKRVNQKMLARFRALARFAAAEYKMLSCRPSGGRANTDDCDVYSDELLDCVGESTSRSAQKWHCCLMSGSSVRTRAYTPTQASLPWSLHSGVPNDTSPVTVQRRLRSRHSTGPPESPEQLSPG
jgi:hypothetical protein